MLTSRLDAQPFAMLCLIAGATLVAGFGDAGGGPVSRTADVAHNNADNRSRNAAAMPHNTRCDGGDVWCGLIELNLIQSRSDHLQSRISHLHTDTIALF